jgi:hypothetical protein
VAGSRAREAGGSQTTRRHEGNIRAKLVSPRVAGQEFGPQMYTWARFSLVMAFSTSIVVCGISGGYMYTRIGRFSSVRGFLGFTLETGGY